ncbi:hypothetical protein N8U78_24605, partial [Enterobacter hormaechei subsp. steigerwaltii]|nr:hypothetical protein [Enterobacter hormaechei subsp. steigerwaltii]MCU3376081.1 hypothetical protein [Enterobacter hormaechei subsp. steigerwaltii]
FGFAENTDDLFIGKTLLHGDVLMWLMKTLLTSRCINQRGAGHVCSMLMIMAMRLGPFLCQADKLNALI